ncbi:hypothetical protein Q5752_000108 [Cryptotrichosporon argae]
MSDLKEPGFKTGDVMAALSDAFEDKKEAEKLKKSAAGIFLIVVKNAKGEEVAWLIDLKKELKVSKLAKGEAAKTKADVTINLSDDTFMGLADGKLNAQKAFMTGAIKVKGQVMLATKLDGVLKAAKAKAKL